MCGIVGYVGERPCRELLLAGLERLEYLGYDSAGVSVLEDVRIDSVFQDQLEAVGQGGVHEHVIPPRIITFSLHVWQTHAHDFRIGTASGPEHLFGQVRVRGFFNIEAVPRKCPIQNRLRGFPVPGAGDMFDRGSRSMLKQQ